MKKVIFTFIILCFIFKLKLLAAHLSPNLQVTARCIGQNEVPAVETDALGLAIFTINADRNAAEVVFQATGLSGAITGIHLHEGNPGENGGVILNLTPFLNGNSLNTTIADNGSFSIASLIKGNYYLNVHTEANPGGEIRAQALTESDYGFAGRISGLNEVIPVLAGGSGFVIGSLSHKRDSLTLSVTYENFTSLPTGMHLHLGEIGTNGGVVVNLSDLIIAEGSFTTTIDATGIADDLLAGNIYLNIHTALNPGGEARAQLTGVKNIAFDVILSGSQEIPDVASNTHGLFSLTLDPSDNSMIYEGYVSATTSNITGAHFHQGALGVNGGVVVNLSSTVTNGYFKDTIDDVSNDLINDMLAGQIYVNIHTEDNPSGEIRGQVYSLAREGYFALLNGGQEVPAVSSTGRGVAMISVDRNQENAHFMTVIDGLEGTFSASHFHNAGPGINGGVVYNITNVFSNNGAFGYWSELGSNALSIRSGEIYINVHTDVNPSGEIRGNFVRGSEFLEYEQIDPSFDGQLLFAGKMSGQNEVGPNVSEEVGVVGLLLDESRTSGRINISVSGLTGDFTGVHLHNAPAGENGGVVVNLTDMYYKNRVTGDIAIDSAMLAELLKGNIYANIHSESFPGGEIRAQLILEQDATFVALLDGGNEVPAVETSARGLASFHLTGVMNTLEINAIIQGLSGPITGAHLHNGISGENGGVVVNLSDLIEGNIIKGVVDASSILGKLDSSAIYINIHTEANPGGEIRGQLTEWGGISFDGWLAGVNEIPSATSQGLGLAVANIDPGLSTITTYALVDNLSGPATAAHFHLGDQSANGGVWINLTNSINGNWISDTITDFALNNVTELIKGDVYMNLHTAAFPGGEVRAQLYNVVRDGYSYDLCPEQETADINNAPLATGSGIASIDRSNSNLHLMSVVSGTSGDLTGFHIHQASEGQDGGVILNLTDLISNGGVFLYHSQENFSESLGNAIKSGETYLNAHTEANPGGELRGQIVKSSLCPDRQLIPEIAIVNPNFSSDILITGRLSGANEVPAVATDGLGVAAITFNEDRTMATLNMTVSNLSSDVTGVHIHGGAAGVNGGVLIGFTEDYNSGRLTSDFAVTDTMISMMINGEVYLNVHTSNNPGGEIRGQLGLESAVSFSGVLSGNNEVPAVETSAMGLVSMHYTANTNLLEVNIQATGLSGPITGIHFHKAAEGENGGVVENLGSYLEGNSVKAKITPGDYIDALMSDSIYLNIHTEANPGGEIRTQITRKKGLVIDSWLDGSQENPSAPNNSIGLGMFVIDGLMENLDYVVVTDNLTGTITGAHLHGGALGQNGGVLVNFSNDINGAVIAGSQMDVSKGILDSILSGDIYVNVHTNLFPAGEIRGQLYRIARDGYSYDVCQDQEVTTPIDAGFASGSGMFAFNRDMDEAHLMVVINELSSEFQGSHIHNAPMGEDGGVIFNFSNQFQNNGAFLYFTNQSATPFNAEFAQLVQAGNTYVNVHTTNNPGGEVRGQIVKNPSCPMSTDVIDIDAKTSIEVNVYPNPTPGNLTLDILGEDKYSIGSQLIVTDLQGRVLQSIAKLNTRNQVDMSDYPAGIYILNIRNTAFSHSLRVTKVE